MNLEQNPPGSTLPAVRSKRGVYASMAVIGTLAAIVVAIGISMWHLTHPGGGRGCLTNMKMLNTALLMYVQDNDDRYPLAGTWNNMVYPYTRTNDILSCPEAPATEKRPTYAINDGLKDAAMSAILLPERTVTLFESIPGKNLTGGSELLPDPLRHNQKEVVGFVDGHIKMIPDDQIADLLWTPHIRKKPDVPKTDAKGGIAAGKTQKAR